MLKLYFMPKRPGRKSLAQTPSPKSERVYGSSKNVKKSATAKKANSIVLSEKTRDVLKDKLSEFKKENPPKWVFILYENITSSC